MQWQVQPVLTGTFGMVRDDIKFAGGDPGIAGMVPSILHILHAENGGVVLVDTGFGAIDEVQSMGLVASRPLLYAEMLQNNHIEPRTVKTILLTHLHWDHAANIGMFPNATLYCQRTDWQYAFSNEAQFPVSLLACYTQNERRFAFLDGDTQVLPGIFAKHLGGHTPGSQCFLAESSAARVLICGDDIMTLRNVRENIPVGLCVHPQGCADALAYACACGAAYCLPSHDFSTLDYPQRAEVCRLDTV